MTKTLGRPRSKGTGSIRKREDGAWLARFQWRDEAGRRQGRLRVFRTRADAQDWLAEFVREFAESGPDRAKAETVTFADLADHYERTTMVPPVYRQGQKVHGLKSLRDLKPRLKTLREHFGKRRLRSITHADLARFKAERLATPTWPDSKTRRGERSIASVHRDLALLRRLFTIAQSEGWIAKNPFQAGPPLISLASEKARDRILTGDEEKRLLAACTGRCAHLRPLVILALDTGCRRGELFALKWAEVDIAGRRLKVRAENSKTSRERLVPLTERSAAALEALRLKRMKAGEAGLDRLVFGIDVTVKTSWRRVCTEAKIENARFHDLRHTCATRLIGAGVPIAEVAKVLGHANLQTTYRHYTNPAEEALERSKAALDLYLLEQVTLVRAERVK